MKMIHLMGGLAAVAVLAAAGGASAQSGSVNQAVPWQFRDANTTVTLQNNVALIRDRMARNKQEFLGFGGPGGSGSGLLGAGASATNNYFQTTNQTIVNNSCAAAAGASLSCGGSAAGGGNTTSGSQTTTGTTNGATTDVNGNTVTNTPQTTVNSNNEGSSFTQPGAQ